MYRICAHQGVIRLLDHFESKKSFYACYEQFSSTTLHDFIINKRKNSYLRETDVKEMARKIGEAIEYLHDNGIILRNLQADGIVMSEDANCKEFNYPKILRLNKAQIINPDAHAHG